jgi:uncharacterized protein (TIGR02996 family)
MSDIAALLLNCLRNPLDDAARLVLADALQEHGDADRAEFVRLQVRDRSIDGDWEPEQGSISVRALRLYKQHVHQWCGGYLTNRFWFSFDPDADEEADGAKGKLERGMLLLAGEPAELEEALGQLPPGGANWLECLEVGDWGDRDAVRALLERPEAQSCSSLNVSWEDEPPLDAVDLLNRDGLRTLTIGQNEGCDALLGRLATASRLRPHKLTLPADEADSRGCSAFLASPVLSELRDLELDLEGNHDAIRFLAAARHVHKLERLYISGDDFPASGLRELFQSSVVSTLSDLSISGYSGNLRDVALSLAGKTALRQLRRLDLGFNEVTTSDGEALAGSQAIESLVHLTFSSGTITDGGLRAIVNSPLLGPLEHLDLSCAGITDAAVVALAGSPKLRGLRYLSLCRCAITARGVRALAESPHLSRLEYLDLGLNPLEPTALDALASSTRLGNLRGLRLSQLTIDAKTLARLVDSPVMRQVQKLDMSEVKLGPDHVRALAAAREFTSLREFSLYGSKGKAGTLAPLLDAPWLDQLVELNLTGMKLDDDCVRRLTRTLRSGNVGILHLDDNAITSRGADALLNWPDLPALGEIGLYGNKIPADREQRIARVVLRPRR